MFTAIKLSDPVDEYNYIDSEGIPLDAFMDSSSIASEYQMNILPLYLGSEITKTINFNNNGFIFFSRTEDSMEKIAEYYASYLNEDDIICKTLEFRLRALGVNDKWIYIVSTWIDWFGCGETEESETYDSRIRVDVAEIRRINLNHPSFEGAFVAPIPKNVGVHKTSVSAVALLNYYATYDTVIDTILFNHEIYKSANITFMYENGITASIRILNSNDPAQRFTGQIRIRSN